MNNPVNWFEIAATNLDRALAFYTQVFGKELQFVDFPGSPMYMFPWNAEGTNAGGAIVKSDQNTPSADGTIVYFECDDVENEAGRVEAAGGKLLFPKMSIGEFGFIAQFIDTEGNRIGLHSQK